MSDENEPISVPVPEQTEEEKAAQEQQFAQADLLKEVLEQLKSQASNVLSSAQGLNKDSSKDEITSVADGISQLASAARNGQGRLDTGNLPTGSYSYSAIRNLSDYCDIAQKDAANAANTDNEEVRATELSNMMGSLQQGISPVQAA